MSLLHCHFDYLTFCNHFILQVKVAWSICSSTIYWKNFVPSQFLWPKYSWN
jgi:hypothetical protein